MRNKLILGGPRMYLHLLIVCVSRFDAKSLRGFECVQVVPPGRLDLRPHHEAEECLRIQEEKCLAVILDAEDVIFYMLDSQVLDHLLLG